MQDDQRTGPPLPDHPQLRQIAVAMEGAGVSGEILDADWKVVFISSEEARIMGLAPEEVDRFYGKSLIIRNIENADVFGITEDSSREWWRTNVPIMRYYLSPDDARFEGTVGPLSKPASRAEPVGDPPGPGARATSSRRSSR